MKRRYLISLICFLSTSSYASNGTEGAAFLDIPVGAGPAALGSAYTALANDAYAPVYNPGGLGFLESNQFAGQHLSYIDTIHYEFLSFAVPLPRSKDCGETCTGSALGGSIQYLGSGDVDGMDGSGNPTGSFSSYYTSYNLSYGKSLSSKLSLGLTGKMIRAKLDNDSASAYAADLGAMYRMNKKLTLAATVNNIGSQLKFITDGDPLPLSFHLGAAYQPNTRWLFTGEGVYAKESKLASFHVGGQWQAIKSISLRAGYRTDTLKGLSALAGLSAGVGINVWNHELAYAWLPYGDLGDTHYVSLVMKFGGADKGKRNLIKYDNVRIYRSADTGDGYTPDQEQLMAILQENDDLNLAKKTPTAEIQP